MVGSLPFDHHEQLLGLLSPHVLRKSLFFHTDPSTLRGMVVSDFTYRQRDSTRNRSYGAGFLIQKENDALRSFMGLVLSGACGVII
jgi:hypothetical protein